MIIGYCECDQKYMVPKVITTNGFYILNYFVHEKNRNRLLLKVNFMHLSHSGGSKCHQQFVRSQLFIGVMQHALTHSPYSQKNVTILAKSIAKRSIKVMLEIEKG